MKNNNYVFKSSKLGNCFKTQNKFNLIYYFNIKCIIFYNYKLLFLNIIIFKKIISNIKFSINYFKFIQYFGPFYPFSLFIYMFQAPNGENRSSVADLAYQADRAEQEWIEKYKCGSSGSTGLKHMFEW